MSSICLSAPAVNAHGVIPAIADVEVTDGQVEMRLELDVEAILAGIDLDGVRDTDEVTEGTSYEQFRAMDAAQLEQAIRDDQDTILNGISVLQADAKVTLALSDIVTEPAGDTERRRTTTLTLVGDVPPGADQMQVGWLKEFGTLVVRQIGVPDPYSVHLEGGALSDPFAIAGGYQQTGFEAFLDYIPVGYEHIVPLGLDHILFVLGLFFFSTALRPLLWQITAFTAAHTVTLALGALGIVNIPGHIVEPIIALSIVYVAVENVFHQRLNPWRPAIIFVFGLLHGLGFASVLGEFGIPESNFIPALLGFNVGVEIGQLSVIAAAFLLVGLWFGTKEWYRRVIAVPASIGIAIVGIYWVIERVFL